MGLFHNFFVLFPEHFLHEIADAVVNLPAFAQELLDKKIQCSAMKF
jgi:hypothetical protein